MEVYMKTREQQMMEAADRHADEVCDESCTGAQVAETINDFCAGWRAADSYPNWISVEEELPKEQGKYMFRLSNGDMCYETYYPKLKLVANVTHWMKIVPPRKEDKNE